MTVTIRVKKKPQEEEPKAEISEGIPNSIKISMAIVMCAIVGLVGSIIGMDRSQVIAGVVITALAWVIHFLISYQNKLTQKDASIRKKIHEEYELKKEKQFDEMEQIRDKELTELEERLKNNEGFCANCTWCHIWTQQVPIKPKTEYQCQRYPKWIQVSKFHFCGEHPLRKRP